MAFDMYAAARHEAFHDQDEYLFTLAEQNKDRYPMLLRIWAGFYSEFVLSPEEAGALVHELLEIYDRHEQAAGKPMASLVLRLARFFSAAARCDTPIRCAGD